MIVLSDASSIIALHKIGRLTLLRLVYTNVAITDQVEREVGIELPNWITVVETYSSERYRHFLKALDPGEASSIAYCLENEVEWLIIDERKGRKVAREHRIQIVGLLGVIATAAKSGLIDDGVGLLDELRSTDFRISERIYQVIRARIESYR